MTSGGIQADVLPLPGLALSGGLELRGLDSVEIYQRDYSTLQSRAPHSEQAEAGLIPKPSSGGTD